MARKIAGPLTWAFIGAAVLTPWLLAWAQGPTQQGEKKQPGPKQEGINNGFFFNKGDYVSPPYWVTLDEDGVKVNGICVFDRPREPEGVPIPTEDPGPFKWTPDLEGKGMHGSGFVKHATARFSYWEVKYGFEEACTRFEEYLKEQPLLAKVERKGDGDFAIQYWTKDGEKDGFGMDRPRERAIADERAGLLPNEGRRFRELLASGGALLVGRGYTTIGPEAAKAILPKIEKVLTSDLPKEERAKELVKRGLLDDADSAKAFVAGFRDFPSLRRRIRELSEEGAKADRGEMTR